MARSRSRALILRAFTAVTSRWQNVRMSSATGNQLLEELRRRRRGGDPRITAEGRQIVQRITTGDLAEVFADALADSSDSDSLLSGATALTNSLFGAAR